MPIEANWNHSYANDCIPNFSTNMELPRHRWYEFKEGFGYSLVERAITETKNITKNNQLTVMDPFSGSGTTPLTALQNNCNAIGLEVNPFLSFVGATKCSKKEKSIEKYSFDLNWIMEQVPIEIESNLEKLSSFSSDGGKSKWLFNKSVLRGFEALHRHINRVESRDIFLLALFSAIMQCCNAKKDGKCLRYKKGWDTLAYSSQELRVMFRQSSLAMISDMDNLPLYTGDRIFYEGDARQSIARIESNTVDLVVFSPPYLNSFDYSDIYRPELFLGGYVTNNDELRLIRKRTLRSHVQCKWKTNDKSKSKWAQNISAQVNEHRDILWDKDIPQMIDAYFFDMEQILKESYRVATKGAHMWFVVGTSSYAGVEIPADLILADIAVKNGWSLINVNALRKLRTSSQCVSDEIRKIRLRESLIICKK